MSIYSRFIPLLPSSSLSLSLLIALGLGLGTVPAHSAQSIQSVTSSRQGGQDVVRITLSEPISALPSGFTIQNPPRIALDFPGVTSALGQTLVRLEQSNLTTASVVDVGERTRIVLNLRSPTSYHAQIEDGALLLYLGAGAKSGMSSANISAPTTSFRPDISTATEATILTTPAIQDIDFRRSREGAGRIILEMGSADFSAQVHAEGQTLVAQITPAYLPASLMRQLDVTDFATPVERVSLTQEGRSSVKLQANMYGRWVHNAYQSGSQFVLEVSKQEEVDPNDISKGPDFSGERLSLNFQNIDVRALLQVIADFTNFNVVTSDTVSGELTLRLIDVPWDQALNIIMEAKGLGMRKRGNVLWVAPREEIDQREQKDLEAARALEKLEPLRTQGFQINYAKAEDLVRKLTESVSSGGGEGVTHTNRFLSNRGSAIAEERTNQIFVTDTPSKLIEVQQLLAKLDIPVRQVLIEARIVEARDTFGRSLGVKFGGGYNNIGRGSIGPQFSGSQTSTSSSSNSSTANGGSFGAEGLNSSGVGGSQQGSNSNVSSNQEGTNWSQSRNSSSTITNNPFFNLPADALSSPDGPATIALSIFNSSMTRFLSLELSAMESEGVGKIISSPKIMTADKQESEIVQGKEIPYRVVSSDKAEVNFKEIALKLKVKPQITPEGAIIMDLEVNKDAIGDIIAGEIAIDKKYIKTQVLVDNGGTIVIGGIFEQQESNQVNKVPLLGDLPGVGNLFKNRTRETDKREMLVFITPRVVNPNEVE